MVGGDMLRASLLFSALDETQLDRVARAAVSIALQPGQVLFNQGEPAHRFYLVTRGRIKLYRLAPSGAEKVIEVVGPGGTFAEALMFLSSPSYPVGAEALEASEVISIDAHDYARMLRGSVDTCFQLLGHLSQRMRALVREIDDLSLHTASCRLAAYLAQHLEGGGEQDLIELDVTKQVLASRLSIKPETFSRIVRDLSEQQVIQVEGRRVRVLDRPRLRQLADVCASPQDSLASTFGRS